MGEGQVNSTDRWFTWSGSSRRKRMVLAGTIVALSYIALALIVGLTGKLYPNERVDLVLFCIPWLEGCDVNWSAFGALAAMVGGVATATAAWMALRSARIANKAQELALIAAETTRINDTLKWLELAEWDLRNLENELRRANAINVAAPGAGWDYVRLIDRLSEQMRLPFAGGHEMRRLMRTIAAEQVDNAKMHGADALEKVSIIQRHHQASPGGHMEARLVTQLKEAVESMVESLRLARSAIKNQITREMELHQANRSAIRRLLGVS